MSEHTNPLDTDYAELEESKANVQAMATLAPDYQDEYRRIQALDFVTRGLAPTDSVEVFLNNVDAVVAYLAHGTKPESTNDQSL